ncbi:hypothetical protein [Frankia sp. CiP1_Cm_nod2]|uniref:hypothetical protein n=1 Tax=Frankia sp. CiP1_Cm_nod2 TaxID=2897161 RepID=UPI002024A3CF
MRYGPIRTRTPTARRDSVISLVCGIIGLFLLGIILGIVAIAFGVRGRRGGGGHLATAGLVLGIVDVALWIVGLTVSNANALVWY